ncbi:hypothetical protein KY289_016983 [Solanum tuberosum]|nr:hypothetical protein KY289_016983 [Solanum tuberosum]
MATTENRSSTFDHNHHNHPLYLSAGDVPGAVHVGIQLVGMENYSLWSRAMRLALLTRNKLGFIDGTIVKAAYTSEQGMQCSGSLMADKQCE